MCVLVVSVNMRFAPSSRAFGRQATKVYSGRGSRRCHAECRAWSFSRGRSASPATKLCRRAAFGRSLRRQPQLSLWAGRAGRTARPDMELPRADCWPPEEFAAEDEGQGLLKRCESWPEPQLRFPKWIGK